MLNEATTRMNRLQVRESTDAYDRVLKRRNLHQIKNVKLFKREKQYKAGCTPMFRPNN